MINVYWVCGILMNDKFNYDLEAIATNYHNSSSSDMHIENAMQQFEWPWIQNQIKKNSSILDLGYGDGISLRNLMAISESLNLKVTLLEGAPTLAKKALAQSVNNIEVILTYFEEFKKNNAFDLIIASHVLEHVNQPEVLLDVLFDNAKVGAELIGIVPNKDSIHRRLAVIMGLQEKRDDLSERDHRVGHLRVFGTDTLSALFKNSNWELVSMKGFFLKPLSNSQMLSYSDSLIDALFKVAEEIPIDLCANIGFIARKVR
jgi:2-polyprenyl-3-methyl-5-hydroxy-6-metoxy-1,4-benzoquinol methylase